MGLAHDKLTTLADDTQRLPPLSAMHNVYLLNHRSFSHLDLSGFLSEGSDKRWPGLILDIRSHDETFQKRCLPL